MDHKAILTRAIQFEIEQMGELAQKPVGNLHHSPAQMLKMAIEHLSMRKPCLRDVVHSIVKTEGEMMGQIGTLETRTRLIELAWRIKREWRLI